ncbi:TonB-dependent receptor [Zeaxanthinibacter sp. PT1]|uniref:TonB-dependent receptor n=1 Tax=Zeaxanthinibacter TaxID=561554 RepID=UPI00234AD493|nr:TonB-dependent receptor [Zeaxanthinibacter sp. PT1]MDC6352386.1 TonB-dependent receptor [Zeaxanthinibacter sp. PT1]
MRPINLFILSVLFLCGNTLMAQEEQPIGTETVTVVKPYSPTVSDAFKIKPEPALTDSIILQKKPIQYTIFSVPVASTFSPSKGRAAQVEKESPESLYNSYLTAAVGNFNNALVDFYTSHEMDQGDQRFDVSLNHFSSRGDIEDTPLDTDFYNSNLGLNYTQKASSLSWGAGIEGSHRLYNWYGIPGGILSEATVQAMDEQQHYYHAGAHAHLETESSFFKRGDILYRRFWDAVDSGENRAVFKPQFQIPLENESLFIKAKVDYVGGSFANADVNNPENNTGIDYGLLQLGINPSLEMKGEDYTLNLGANFVYGQDLENNDSNFYIYPSVKASYRLLEESAIVYVGVEGELEQNSYYGYTRENPYVSPTLQVVPTDRQYDAYLGLKGQLLPNLSYNFKGSYTAENRKPLYLLNAINEFRDDEKAYHYGNSFELFYDDVKTLGLFGELNVDVNRNFSLGINAAIYDYNTETGNPAWNLPNTEASLFLDYQIGEQWYVGGTLFYVGEREDLATEVVTTTFPSEPNAALVTLDSYFDANAHVGYRFSEQFSVFVRGSNLADNQYQRWANFRVQSLQVLGGLTYKFDL